MLAVGLGTRHHAEAGPYDDELLANCLIVTTKMTSARFSGRRIPAISAAPKISPHR